MKKSRLLLIVAQVLAVVLFIEMAQRTSPSTGIGFWIPFAVVLLIVVNSFWFTRFVSWLIFAISFFSFCVALSAFTLRWRLETGFDPRPFYKVIVMHAVFIYIGLGQLKILGGSR